MSNHDSPTCSEAGRRALRKCALRQPGDGVYLEDDEIAGLFDWLTAMGRMDAIEYIEKLKEVMG